MEYEVMDKDAFTVIGKRLTTPYAGGTWGVIKSDGTYEKMQEVAEGKLFFGLCFGFGEDGSNDYMVGFEHEGTIPAGYDSFEYPDCKWLFFKAYGTISGQTLPSVWAKVHEFIDSSKYEITGLPTIERYVEWDEEQDICKVDILFPVK